MDRLTEHNVYFDGQHGFLAKGFDAIEQRPFSQIIRQLALYEDTGLMPEEIQQVKAERDAAVNDGNEKEVR